MPETAEVTELLADLPDRAAAVLVARGEASRRSPDQRPPTPQSARYRGVRRERFLDGRAAASDALDRLGLGATTVGVGPAGEPRWPTGTVGSISHARQWSLAVVAPTSAVAAIGVDVEDDREVRGIGSYVLTPPETRRLADLEADERRRALLSVFSAKEAVYKAAFPRVQRFFGFHAVTLEPAAGGFVAAFVTAVDDQLPVGRRFAVRSRWVGDLVASWTTLEPA